MNGECSPAVVALDRLLEWHRKNGYPRKYKLNPDVLRVINSPSVIGTQSKPKNKKEIEDD